MSMTLQQQYQRGLRDQEDIDAYLEQPAVQAIIEEFKQEALDKKLAELKSSNEHVFEALCSPVYPSSTGEERDMYGYGAPAEHRERRAKNREEYDSMVCKGIIESVESGDSEKLMQIIKEKLLEPYWSQQLEYYDEDANQEAINKVLAD